MYTVEFEDAGKRIKSDGKYDFAVQTRLPAGEDRDEPAWSTDGHYPRLSMALRNLIDDQQRPLGDNQLGKLAGLIRKQNERLEKIARMQFYREFLIEELRPVTDAPSEEQLGEMPTEDLESLFDRYIAPTWHRLS